MDEEAEALKDLKDFEQELIMVAYNSAKINLNKAQVRFRKAKKDLEDWREFYGRQV